MKAKDLEKDVFIEYKVGSLSIFAVNYSLCGKIATFKHECLLCEGVVIDIHKAMWACFLASNLVN